MSKKQLEDKEYTEIVEKIIRTTGLNADNTHLNTTLETQEGCIVNSYGVIIGVQKLVYNKKDNTRVYLFEIIKTCDNKYRVIAEDNNRGLHVTHCVNSMKELDELLQDNNPFRDVMYNFIGDKFKGTLN